MTLIEFRGGVLDGKLIALYVNPEDESFEKQLRLELNEATDRLPSSHGNNYVIDSENYRTTLTPDGMVSVSLLRAELIR